MLITTVANFDASKPSKLGIFAVLPKFGCLLVSKVPYCKSSSKILRNIDQTIGDLINLY